MRGLGLEMLITELVPGPDDACRSYYTFVDEAGQTIAEATKHKLRQFPVGYGLTTYHITEHNEETRDLGRRFCAGVGVKGVACVEFKRDPRDGQLKVIECNSRFTAGNELIRHAGLDLALLAYNRVTGRPDPPRRCLSAGLADVASRRGCACVRRVCRARRPHLVTMGAERHPPPALPDAELA